MDLRYRLSCLLLVFALSGCASIPAPERTDRVTVSFTDDAVQEIARNTPLESEKAKHAWQDTLGRHIAQSTAARLPPDDTLRVRITLIERAGAFEPWRGAQGNNVRIVRDIYPPHIDLEFVQANPDGKIVRQGHRELRDMNFMMHINRYSEDALRYEKALLDDWILKEFPTQ